MNDNFARLLRRYRREAGLSQEALAEKAALSKDAVSALEREARRAPYRDTVDLLAKGLGLDGADRREFEAAAARARQRASSNGDEAHPSNLPLMATSLVGRDEVVREILLMLEHHRIVTIVGTGGIGKTRVAVEAAEQFARVHGSAAWFADLATVTQGATVISKIASAAAVGIAGSGEALAELTDSLRARRGLIVLDNCEHVVEECAKAAVALAGAGPDLQVLATSRERLAISGESVYQLGGLDHGAAEELFKLRASSAGFRSVVADANAEALHDICAEVDNIPLAIELAAARAPLLGLSELRARLRGQLAVLSGGDRNAPARQHAMRDTIGWSYDLLGSGERALFRRLAAFAGGWSLSALEPEDLDAFSTLLEKSLVTVDLEAEPVRYRLLEPIRAFALEQLRTAGELDATLERHARWMADFSDSQVAESDSYTPEAVATAVRELDNARAALEWSLRPGGDVVVGARVLGGMRTGWLTTGLAAECRHWCELILAELDQDANPAIAAKVFRAAIAGTAGEGQIALMQRAIVASERAGDWNGVIVLTSRLAARYGERGSYEEAERAFARVASIRESTHLEPNADWIGMLVHRAHFLCRQRRLDEAVAAIDEAIALARRLQRPYHEMSALLNAAEIVFTRGDSREAIHIASQALAMSATYQHVVAEVCARANCAGYYLAAGDVEAAKREACAAISRGLKVDANIVSTAILHLATVRAMVGDPVTAARLKGFLNAHRIVDEAELDPSEITSYGMLSSALTALLSAEELAEYTRQGALLDGTQAAGLACG